MTRAPAPAATMAAVVLTLKVLCPSPPVPTMSTTKSLSASSTAAFNARSLRTSAAAARESGLRSTRFTCSAVRNAPICTGKAASGVKTCSRARRRSSGVKYSGVWTSFFSKGLKESEVRLEDMVGGKQGDNENCSTDLWYFSPAHTQRPAASSPFTIGSWRWSSLLSQSIHRNYGLDCRPEMRVDRTERGRQVTRNDSIEI